MSHLTTTPRTCSDRLLEALADYERFLIVMHDNPDPDAIASGWAIHCLIEEKLDAPVRLVAGGAITRAENLHMVELLLPPIELVGELTVAPDTATILVDCNCGANNQLLGRQSIDPVAVIDHHAGSCCRRKPAFRDVRPEIAASATIAASYLREQELEPSIKLATALAYAMRSETSGCEFHYSELDRSILLWLAEWVEPSMLAEIENAPLSIRYFGDLLLAMQSTFLYGNTAMCLLPRAHGTEAVGEVADLLIRCDAVQHVLCGAVVGEDLVLSARTKPGGPNATALLQETIEGLGGCGGHTCRAGGKIAHAVDGTTCVADLRSELLTRWLAACGATGQSPRALVPRWEIMANL